jgi:hypothetical protein
MSQECKEIKYRCADAQCGNEQTIRYFTNDPVLPVTCCVKCRAGFGKELKDQMAFHIGMFPVGRAS